MYSVGSVCSGIEAASVAWENLGFQFKWFSEIADFPSKLLKEKYPLTPNLGDMSCIADLLKKQEIFAPSILCAGTPCQAFSLAGLKKGFNDVRGSLTKIFVDIVDANDIVRKRQGLEPTIVFWENVEGVLSDKTDAFLSFVSILAGVDCSISQNKLPSAGVVLGTKRNVAWRVLDAKYFGIPQQRRRLYLLAGGKDFCPEKILFENITNLQCQYPKSQLTFVKEGHNFEIFREYTDCLYSAYGTKWNGNAAAYNGSLYVVQDNRIRRLSPLECERLMGFPDNYSNLKNAKRTNRYQALGNSWAVPVVKWIGLRLVEYTKGILSSIKLNNIGGHVFVPLGDVNVSVQPQNSSFGSMMSVVQTDVPEELFISPTACCGILRRKNERNLKINNRLEKCLSNTASMWSMEYIERCSRVQKRGAFATVTSC